MPLYSLYFMNPVSGHIDRRDRFHAGDDVSAVHLLQGMRLDGPAELWRDGRKVARQDGPASPFRSHVLRPAPAPAPAEPLPHPIRDQARAPCATSGR